MAKKKKKIFAVMTTQTKLLDSFCYVTENVTFEAKKGEKLASVEEIYKAMLDVAAQHAAEVAKPWERELNKPIVLYFSVHKIK